MPPTPSDLELARHIIDFDPRAPQHYRFAAEALSPEAVALAARATLDPIPWPAGLAPTPVTQHATEHTPLPKVDALVVTYTVAEGHALADVLTPGIDTTGWNKRQHGWDAIKPYVRSGAPSLGYDRSALWYLTKIGDALVAVVKSELHPAIDGTQLPLRLLWEQLVAEGKPKLVITTGTAGAVGSEVQLGDVIVSQTVRWDCTKSLASQPYAHQTYTGTDVLVTSHFAGAFNGLVPVNAGRLPNPPRPAQVWQGPDVATVSTDFFAFDDAADHYGLRAYEPLAHAVEMDDAALPLALQAVDAPPAWVSVRNASDPQMNEATLEAERTRAAAIYETWGLITSAGSAITAWALVAGLA